ncbi:MAG: hypothetical protein QM487_09485 [Candidatus Marithrix sp.]
MDSIIYINNIEIVLLGLCLPLLFIVAFKENKSIKKSMIVVFLLILPLYLAVEGTSQFLTVDEMYMVPEIVNIESSNMQQWVRNKQYRTSATVIGTSLSLFKNYTYIGSQMNFNELQMLAKAIHWFVGFLIIIAMYILISKHYISKKQRTNYFLIYFYSILLLPVNILGLKIFNYDLLSMLLSGLAIVLLLIAIKTNNYKYALISVIVATTAAQEKITASPILLLTCIFFVYIKLNNLKKVDFKNALYYSGYGYFVTIVTSLIMLIIVGMVARNGDFPTTSFADLISSLLSYVFMVLRGIAGGGTGGISEFVRILVFFLIVMATGIVAFILVKYKSWLTFLFSSPPRKITGIAVLVLCIVGIIGTYQVEAFLYPYYPISPGNYIPSHFLVSDRILHIWHFGASSYFEHLISYIGYAYAVFVNAIPSVYLLIIFLDVVIYQSNKLRFDWNLILLMIFLLPLVYAITSTPVSHRYFNIFLLIAILIVGLKLNHLLSDFNQLKQKLLVSLFAVFLITEVLPFRPVFGAFRPIWSTYPNEYLQNPIVGQVNPSSVGWGEELFLAGKKIETMIEASTGNKINLHKFYPGGWINMPKGFNAQYNFPNIGGFTKSDYYIINRRSVMAERVAMIDDIEPLFTLSYRGFIQTWVYRGDQLKYKKQKILSQWESSAKLRRSRQNRQQIGNKNELNPF